LTKVLEPDGNNNPSLETDYQYDALNNLTRVDQWGGPSGSAGDRFRTFTYDSLSRLLTAFNPETGTVCYGVLSGSSCVNGYDGNGNLINKTDARGITIMSTYDALNRMIKKVASDGSFTYEYFYDSPGHGASIGRLVHASNDINAAYDPSYDSMGRVTSQTYCIPSDCSNTTKVSAQYDLAGNLTQLTYPDGQVINQTWNGAGEVSQITGSSGYQYLTPQTAYFPNGTVQATGRGNGIASGEVMNSRQRPLIKNIARIGTGAPGNFSGTPTFSLREFCYGPATPALTSLVPGCPDFLIGDNGNLLHVTDAIASRVQNFQYDNLNRLSAASQADGSFGQLFGLDTWGNMTLTATAPSTFFTTNNRIAGLGYDAAGNLTASNIGSVTTNNYAYDGEGKLVNINNGGAVYTYDADGNRVRKDAQGTFTEYIQFGGRTIAEKQADGTWSNYIYANGQLLARSDNYDIRIHVSGTNCSGCGSNNSFGGTTSLTAAVGHVIQSGDVLAWRQFQDGVGSGGVGLFFNNSVASNGVLRDTDGQLADADTTMNTWHIRTADLSQYAGMTLTNFNVFNTSGGAPGNWDVYFGDIVLVSPDGSFIPIYSRGMEGLSTFQGAAVSNLSVITEKVADTDPLTTTTYYGEDQLGSTEIVTSGIGWPVSRYGYLPYGVGPMPGTDHYLYTGKERDTESGLDYFGARYYNSTMGRFLSPDDGSGVYSDPTNPQSWNLYSYVLNNPLTGVDPDGHDCIHINVDTGAYEGTDQGDCDNSTEEKANSGQYVDGTVNAINENSSGQVTGFSGTSYDGNLMTGTFASPLPYGPLEGPENLAGASLIGNTAGGVVNAVGTAEMNMLLPLMPELLLGTLPEVGLGIGGVGAAAGGTHPSTPTGRRGSPMDVPRGTNAPATINGRQYTGHALDQMQSRGIPSSVVEDAIQNGIKSPGNTSGTTVNLGPDVKVVTNSSGGVVTVIPR
jgi:RHS repeat-associated protein